MKKSVEKGAKSKTWIYILVAAAAILLIVLATKPVDLSGKAYLVPIQVYGEVLPTLPDNTNISFKAGVVDLGSALIKGGKYGYEPKLYLKIDNPNTPLKEGYSQGDTVSVYIEGILISEFSYLESFELEKKIIVPAGKREEVSNKIASVLLCSSEWECSEWSQCDNGIQTRSCSDKSSCRFPKDVPVQSRQCSAPVVYEQPTAAEEKPDNLLVYLGILFAALILFIVIFSKRKKGEAQQPQPALVQVQQEQAQKPAKKAKKKEKNKKAKGKKR